MFPRSSLSFDVLSFCLVLPSALRPRDHRQNRCGPVRICSGQPPTLAKLSHALVYRRMESLYWPGLLCIHMPARQRLAAPCHFECSGDDATAGGSGVPPCRVHFCSSFHSCFHIGCTDIGQVHPISSYRLPPSCALDPRGCGSSIGIRPSPFLGGRTVARSTQISPGARRSALPILGSYGAVVNEPLAGQHSAGNMCDVFLLISCLRKDGGPLHLSRSISASSIDVDM